MQAILRHVGKDGNLASLWGYSGSAPFLVILIGDSIMGFDAGMALHSLGFMDRVGIIAVLLNQKFGRRNGEHF